MNTDVKQCPMMQFTLRLTPNNSSVYTANITICITSQAPLASSNIKCIINMQLTHFFLRDTWTLSKLWGVKAASYRWKDVLGLLVP